MRLNRTFYYSWCLVVVGSLWPLLLLEANAQTTDGHYVSAIPDEGSGEIQDVPGNIKDDLLSTSGQNNSKVEGTQNNQTENHQEIFPEDHFIWITNSVTYAYEGQALEGHVMVEYDNAYSVTQCSDRCMRYVPECRSYNYQEDTHICQLNSQSDVDFHMDLRNLTGSTYYRTSAFQTHESILGACSDLECMNGGRCLDLEKFDTDPPAICSCPFEYGSDTTCTGSPELTSWGAWSEWGSCTVTCGEGWRRRYRECPGHTDNQGELYCVGEAVETEKCVLDTCPYWENWSSWSDCSAGTTCGSGSQMKSRTCRHGGTPGVDRMCMGQLTANKTCDEPGCSEAVKLSEYSVYGSGSVEVYDNLEESWVSVCASNWNKPDADVICRQLGFHDGAAFAITNGSLPAAESPALLSDVGCEGDEYNIQNCNHNGWGSDASCDTNKAGVLCTVDGMWGGWTEWSGCSVTCADGIQTRTRECDNPPPVHGGDYCPEEDTQHKNCTMIPCPVDGTWKIWAEWSSCNVTCGGGRAFRTRECNLPKHNGEPCPGPADDWKTCNTHHCPVNGSWQPWQEWQDCNITCGGGRQVRERECTPPQHGGETCQGPHDERRDCNTHPCPVRCVWNPWLDWQPCDVTCGNGTQQRNRTKQEEQHGGDPCVGDIGEIRSCKPRECPVDGSWKEWEMWSSCSETCGNGTRERNRSCNYGLHGGANCTGPSMESEHCFLKSCAIDGVWEKWTEWSLCSVTCNNGTQTRNRSCTGPFYGGEPCPGPADAVRECFPMPCPVDGVWNPWSTWSPCPVTCGGDLRSRNRTCHGPFHNGVDCGGDSTESESCGERPCPEDGYWLAWSSWSDCSLSCGNGTQSRGRTCNSPQHGGQTCPGDASEERGCNTFHCPVHGSWNAWTEWSDCTVTCGGGNKTRDRTCVEPLHGGDPCEGPAAELEYCGDDPCPVDGQWSSWTRWMGCNATCGGGREKRYRTCNAAKHGGSDCGGDDIEWRSCAENPCPINGEWQEWGDWLSCNVTCGGGVQWRHRVCQEPQYGGDPCPGPADESQSCNTLHCPVDGLFREWTKWEECSAVCGGGRQVRRRECEAPLHGGEDCVGEPEEWQDCNTQPCPVDGYWMNWGEWGDCSTTCGGGTRNRSRSCVQPKHDGNDCPGLPSDVEACSENPCPIPGEWQAWEEWGRCSLSCGGGTRQRVRQCNMTSYGDLTIACIGSNVSTGACHEFDCTPYKYTCSEWVETGLENSFIVDVDPDGELGVEPFKVYCNVSDGINGSTTIHHDLETRTQVQGFEGAGEYSEELQYLDPFGEPLSLTQVMLYAQESKECRQYISWECYSAGIHHPQRTDLQITYWKNANMDSRYYWGGVDPSAGKGDKVCGCWMTESCDDPSLRCNCDMNDQTWRRDDGYITVKEDLPISMFLAGDTGGESNEEGAFTIGPLICSG